MNIYINLILKVDILTQIIEIVRSFNGRVISFKPLTVTCK